MTSNPLLKILPFLTRKEMTRFREFAHSPYFNKHQNVRALVSLLSQIYPNFDEKRCNRKVLFATLFQNESHNQSKLALVFTYTLRLFEKFIRLEYEIQSGIMDNPNMFLRFIRERDVSFLVENKWQENYNGGNFIYDKYSLIRLQWAVEMDALSLRLGKHGRDFMFEKQAYLDAIFLREKLKDACELFLRSRFLKRPFEQSEMLKMVCLQVEKNEGEYADFPEIGLFLKCFRLLSGHSPTTYPMLRKEIVEKEKELDKDSLQSLLNYLQNFCIARINQGDEPFLRHLFDIYRSQLERSLLFEHDRLPEWHYKNIVTTGLRLEEDAWVFNFIEAYKSKLDQEVAENAYSYNLAAYYYHLQRFDEVLKLLVQVEYTDLRYNLDAKSMLLRTYYDLDEEEPLFALCDAFRQYLKRNKSITDFQKKGYNNLIKYARKAFRLKMNKGFVKQNKWSVELEKLENEIEKEEAVFNKKWLLGKLEDLN